MLPLAAIDAIPISPTMSPRPKPSKKHHFVPQAQLRHFAADPDRSSIWVSDKRTGRAWISSILNAGSENDFNTVELNAQSGVSRISSAMWTPTPLTSSPEGLSDGLGERSAPKSRKEPGRLSREVA